MFWVAVLVSGVIAIHFDLQAQDKRIYRWGKCITMQIGPKKLVTGLFKLGEATEQVGSARISDNYGNIHYSRSILPVGEVRFSFRTHDKTLNYNFCLKTVLENEETPLTVETREAQMVVEIGHDLFDTGKANEIKIQPVVKEMIRLGGIMYDLSDGLDQIIIDKQEIRKNNRSIFKRVLIINVFSIGVMIFAGGWQIYHLRKFFKTKKLI